MIMPSKHVNVSESLLGFGAYILSILKGKQTIDELWQQYLLDYEKETYNAKQSFNSLILTLTFLYSLGILDEEEGSVYLCV